MRFGVRREVGVVSLAGSLKQTGMKVAQPLLFNQCSDSPDVFVPFMKIARLYT